MIPRTTSQDSQNGLPPRWLVTTSPDNHHDHTSRMIELPIICHCDCGASSQTCHLSHNSPPEGWTVILIFRNLLTPTTASMEIMVHLQYQVASYDLPGSIMSDFLLWPVCEHIQHPCQPWEVASNPPRDRILRRHINISSTDPKRASTPEGVFIHMKQTIGLVSI